MPRGVVVLRQMEGIDLGRDAADGNAVAMGNPERGLGVLEKRVLGPVEVNLPFEKKRRDPVRVVLIQPVRQMVKFAPTGAPFNRNDRYRMRLGG
jgi:hypothetical protein